ncbi:hypothetical protein NIES593_14565 [Hydrococcus rivularis NIES-593]|uniref:Uncharacterized protein n=1 Tax=Hydrococcus rivularis NIES-593 TaxID=1921803 RepID=A0A1U7HE82_9CYAN|nr:hypothetical protein NIES593_14565 [Hydrococcus rivularis NIES-593]
MSCSEQSSFICKRSHYYESYPDSASPKLVVMVQWGWNYFTRGRGARLVTGEDTLLALKQCILLIEYLFRKSRGNAQGRF